MHSRQHGRTPLQSNGAHLVKHIVKVVVALFCAGAYAGLRSSGVKADLALIVADQDAVVGGTFTTNVMCAAPVLYCKDVLTRKETCRVVRAACGSAVGRTCFYVFHLAGAISMCQ